MQHFSNYPLYDKMAKVDDYKRKKTEITNVKEKKRAI